MITKKRGNDVPLDYVDNYNLKVMTKTELINYAQHSADELAYIGKRIVELTKSLDSTHTHHQAPVVGCPSCDKKLLALAREISGDL